MDGAELTGSLAIMLLVCSLLANSTGLALFFLFGTSEGVFAAPAERLRQAARTFGGDAMESAAAGSGYENVPTAAEAAKKEAGELITKMAVRHRHPTALLGGRHPTQQI